MDSLTKYTFLFNVEGLNIIRDVPYGAMYRVSHMAIGGDPCIVQYFAEEPSFESYEYIIKHLLPLVFWLYCSFFRLFPLFLYSFYYNPLHTTS